MIVNTSKTKLLPINVTLQPNTSAALNFDNDSIQTVKVVNIVYKAQVLGLY